MESISGQVQEPVHQEKRKRVLHFSDGVEEVTDSDDDVDGGGGPEEDVPSISIDEVIY